MIAGGGFAVMAWELARERKCPFLDSSELPVKRASAVNFPYFPASREYYAILDLAWEAWHQPQLISIAGAGIPVTVRL